MNVEHIKKGWGEEVIFANNKNYCGKLLVFDKKGSCGSMHYHMIKDETWYVQKGKFMVSFIDTRTATVNELVLKEGDVWHNPPGFPHCLAAMEDESIVFEVSTEDNSTDNYRVFKGDSQK